MVFLSTSFSYAVILRFFFSYFFFKKFSSLLILNLLVVHEIGKGT